MSISQNTINAVLHCAREFYSNVFQAASGGHRKIVLMWAKDKGGSGPISLDIDTTSYVNVAALQPGINVVIDKIIQDRLITYDPPSRGRIIYIFALEISGFVHFTIAKNVSRRCRPADLPLSEVHRAAAPDLDSDDE